MTSVQIEKTTKAAEKFADQAGTMASEKFNEVSHDLQKAATVLAHRAQDLIKRENVEKALSETRAVIRRHPVESALIAAGIVAVGAATIYALNRRSRSLFA